MKRRHLNYQIWKKEMMKDPEFKAEYDRRQPEFAVINALIEARIKKGLTQSKLALKLKTKQSVISRLESGDANPSIGFLKKLAAAVDTHLEIKFVPR